MLKYHNTMVVFQEIPNEIRFVKENTMLKVGWYIGIDTYHEETNFKWFDYIKLGHYNKETTNQHLYKLTHTKLDDGVKKIDFEDITSKFWK